MDSTSKRDTEWATEALRTFWRRALTQLAVRHEQAARDKLKQAQECREQLKGVR